MMLPRQLLRFVFLFTIAALAAAAVWAQVGASISGRVTDSSGGAVNGATVTAKSLETGATRSVTTNENGYFSIFSLPLGPQELKVEKTGFKSAVRTGVNLVVGQQATVNVQLEVGEFVQQVVVSSDTPIVNATTSSVAGVVGEQQVKDLPLNGRSFDNLIALNPGTINYSAMKSPGTSTSNGNTFSVAGRRTSENLVLLNGIEYTGSSQLAITPGGVSGNLLGIEAVREFNVLTDTYSAEYGKRAGAQVSVVTQSGTNDLHGSVYEFLRNNAFDARNFFAKGATPFKQNQFGAAMGGPLRKNRLFLFGNYEGFRQALTTSNVSVVPDSEARLGFLPNSVGVETKVTGLNPVMLQYMPFWPAQNGPEQLSNGVPTGTALSFNSPNQSIREDFGTARTDYKIGDRDTLSGVYTIDDGNSLIPLADPLFASYSALRMQVASVQETHIFSPNVLNTFRAGFSRAGFNLDSSLLAPFPASLDFVTGAGPGGIVIGGGVTTTGIAALTSAGPNNAAGVWNRRNLFTYTDTVQMSKGIHQISFGVWFQRMQDNEDSASRQLGQASFNSLQTFLQGTTSSFQVVPDPNALSWRSWFGAWYAEDTIKVRPNLSIEAGIRHEFTTGWNEANGRAANYLVSSGILETNPEVSNSVFTQNNAKFLFEPRIGLAWDVFGTGKTAVRAGFGTYYSLIDDLAFLLNSLPPYNGAVSYTNTALLPLLPVTPGVPPAHSCGPGIPQLCTTFAPQGVQADAKTPAVEEWNLTVEQQLNRSTVLRVAYVGSHGYHGLLSIDPNTIPAQSCSSPTGCTAGGTPGTTKSTVPQGAQYIPVQSRPNPYLGAGFFWFTNGNSSYNALEADVTHRLRQGLEFRANYTWSKNLDVNSGLTGAQANNQAQMVLDRGDVSRDWGPSALNVTSVSSISALYELPFGKGKAFFGNLGGRTEKFISGWQLNGIASLMTGFPFTPLIGSNRSGDGDTRNPDRPSIVTSSNLAAALAINPSAVVYNPSAIITGNPNQWFNPNAFILPPAGTYGNLGRGTLTGPGLADLDLSLFKTTAVSERASVQFRAEFFNVLNHPNFGLPNTTAFASGSVSGSAGLITTTATPSREIQLALKLIF